MSITAKELAKQLNLSEAAVSMALNNKPGVSTQTRKKVIALAKDKGYDFSRVEQTQLPSGPSGTIQFIIYRKNGAVVGDTPFFSQLSEGIDTGCRQARYFLNITYLYEDENLPERLSKLLAPGCRGIILLGTEMDEHAFAPFLTLPVPVVVLDTFFEGVSANYVQIANIQGAFLAAGHLIRKYRTQPGYLQSSYPIGNFSERADGFYKAIRKNGMPASKSPVHRLSPSMEGAYEDMRELLRQGEAPARCYFADNDLIAAGAVRALKEAGYRIPQDVSVIGFDDMPLCAYVEPALSTVRVPKQYMGQMAVRRLTELMADKNASPVKIEIETSLVLRQS